MKIIYPTIIRSYNFTAKVIHLGMWLWRVTRGLPKQTCYNHAELGYDDMTSGAISEGVKTRKWRKYIDSFKRVEYIRYKVLISDERWDEVKSYLDKAEGTPYEFENFYWHLIKIITGKWKGSKTTRQTYCYEHVLRVLKIAGYEVDVFWNPYEFKN